MNVTGGPIKVHLVVRSGPSKWIKFDRNGSSGFLFFSHCSMTKVAFFACLSISICSSIYLPFSRPQHSAYSFDAISISTYCHISGPTDVFHSLVSFLCVSFLLVRHIICDKSRYFAERCQTILLMCGNMCPTTHHFDLAILRAHVEQYGLTG